MNQVKIELFSDGHYSQKWEVPASWNQCIKEQNWEELDRLAGQSLEKGGELHEKISKLCPIHKTEHILSLRSAPDETGIWHDDGSRDLAFSLALSFEPFEGRGLSLRKKNQSDTAISLGFRPYGTLTCFLTGANDFEHRTEEVLSGERLVLAGWIN